jgi:hypothetical protein
MSNRRRVFSVLSFTAGFLASACTAILVPDEDDDGVNRCNNLQDCKDIKDNRYRPQCVHADGQPENSDKVCVADFAEIRCGGEFYNADHPLTKSYLAAVASKAVYGQCSTDNRGKQGCPPPAGEPCDPGLEVNEAGTCDDPDNPIPALHPPTVGGIDIAGQDAKDQFCRWYFCDETFVCARSGSVETCRPCSGTDPNNSGGGACGELYIQGERSSIYTELDDANCNGDLPSTDATFGPTPVVP